MKGIVEGNSSSFAVYASKESTGRMREIGD